MTMDIVLFPTNVVWAGAGELFCSTCSSTGIVVNNNDVDAFIRAHKHGGSVGGGLTAREVFAGLAMLAKLGANGGESYYSLFTESVQMADALIAELAKSQRVEGGRPLSDSAFEKVADAAKNLDPG